MTQCVIHGLPGLYQNWLSAALDSNAVFEKHGINFLTSHSAVPWVSKHTASDIPDVDVINCYVANQNLPWYLYNFFEKTDDVNIRVEHWCEDIQLLAPNTVAYQGMLDHWQQTYHIVDYHNHNYVKNSAIEYFYLFFIKDSHWRHLLSSQTTHGVNIEYNDFASITVLREKLSLILDFDDDHFVKMYAALNASNQRYLKLPQDFGTKLLQLPLYNSFTIIELAWLGALFYQMDGIQLDWFNPDVRHRTIVQRYAELRCNPSNNSVII